jgi:hypothetical protein
MSGTAPWKAAAPMISLSEFIGGKTVDFGPQWSSYGFSYSDSRWYFLDVLAPGQPLQRAVCNFGRLPAWMMDDAKKCMASAWLEHNQSAGTLAGYMNALSIVARAFPAFKGGLLELSSRHARDFTAYLQTEVDERRLASGTCATTALTLKGVFRILRSLPENQLRSPGFVARAPRSVRVFMARQRTAFNAHHDKLIPDETIAALVVACSKEEAAYEAVLAGEADARELVLGYANVTMPYVRCREILLNRAIQAQLLKLAICFGRRITALCALPVAPELEDTNTPHGRVLLLYLRESKLKNATEIVRAPGIFAELACDAIAKVLRYTAEFREAARDAAEYLFLMSSLRRSKLFKVITGTDFNRYLSGTRPPNGPVGEHSLIARYGITVNGRTRRITSHNFRTTRLTRIAEHAGLTVAFQDAGHLSPDMTSHFYVAATGALREQAERALTQGACSGEVADMIAGRAEGERVSPRMVQRLMDRAEPMIVNVTRYGLCFLQAETGPCPTGNACWLGVDPEAPAIAEGRGCEWQGLTVAAIPALVQDEKALTMQIEMYAENPSFRHFVRNLERRLEIVRRQLVRAQSFVRVADHE